MSAPSVLRNLDLPRDRLAVRTLFDRLPAMVSGQPLQLPSTGPPELFLALYGSGDPFDQVWSITAKHVAPGMTVEDAILRSAEDVDKRWEGGKDGDLIWARLSGQGIVQMRWGTADGSWSFSAVAPDGERLDALMAAFARAAAGE